jgi:hypothetical protein
VNQHTFSPHSYQLQSASIRRPSDSSARPPATARTSSTTLLPLANFTTLLSSSLDIAFARIPVSEFDKCRRFILANPQILEHDPGLFLREATAAHRSGKIQYARSCIQQALLIRELDNKNERGRRHFFEDLANEQDPEVLEEFTDNFDRTLEYVQRGPGPTAPTPQRPPGYVPATYSQASGGDARRSREDNLAPAMSGMTIQPTSDRPNYNSLSSYPHPREPTAQVQPDYRSRRTSDTPRVTLDLGIPPGTSKGTTIQGTPGERELDPNYSKRRDARRFFSIGRVFALIWHEPAGGDRGAATSFRGENVYTSVRRMVVVRELHGACWAIPIYTYGNKGVEKRGFDHTDIRGHAVIYMTGKSPYTPSTEPRMSKNPIEVDPANNQELERMSRVNFTKVHTVEHEVKVLHIGRVSQRSMPDFEKYWADQARPVG